MPIRRTTGTAIFFYFAIPFFLAFPIGYYLTAFSWAQTQYQILHDCVPVKATVVSSKVKSLTGAKGEPLYAPDVQYEYEVDGQKFHSDRYMPLPLSGNEYWAGSVVEGYPVGKSIQAYYDPADPARAVLIPQYSANPYDAMLGFAFCVVVTLFILFYLWFAQRSPPAPVENGWIEIRPLFGRRKRLLLACICAVTFYALGVAPLIHYFLCVPASAHLGVEDHFKVYAIIGLVPVAFAIWYGFRNRSLDEARLRLDSEEVVLGKPCVYKIAQRARRSLNVGRVRLQVICSGTVKGKPRARRTLYQAILCELTNQTLRAGESLDMSGTLTLPADQRPSGRDDSGEFISINWRIALDYGTGISNYRANFPMEIQRPISETAPR